MSELVLTSTALVTAVLAVPLLTAAGVALAAEALARLGVSLSQWDVPAMAQEFVREAQRARSRFLRQLATQAPKEVAEALARVQAIQEACSRQPVLGLVAEAQEVQRGIDRWREAQGAFQRRAFDRALRAARQAEETLAQAAHQAWKRLSAAQQAVVAQAVRRALPSLGYRVEEASDGRAVAFRAQAGEHVLGVVVLDGGRLLVDAAGFPGMGCRSALEAFYRRLREEGVEVRPTARWAHQRREGGPLLTWGKGAQGLLEGAARLQAVSPAWQEEGRKRAALWLWTRQTAWEGRG